MATQPIPGLSSATPIVRPSGAAPSAPDPGSVMASPEADDAVSVDIAQSVPPPEVLHAIAAASAAYDDLAAQGLTVSFGTDPESGSFQAQLQDHTGTVHSALKPSEVLALAEGKAPEQTRKSPDVHQQRQLD